MHGVIKKNLNDKKYTSLRKILSFNYTYLKLFKKNDNNNDIIQV